MSKLEAVLDAQARNQQFSHYDIKVVMVPHEHVRRLSQSYHRQQATISTDRHLTNDGKAAALAKAQAATRAAIIEWHDSRLKSIDADLLEQRAALMASATAPDPKRVEMMSSQLLKHTPQDIAVFYGSASDDERRVMEAASASVGRVPMITPNGKEWKTLLDPAIVDEAILTRAEATNPIAAQRVRELTEIRAMQVTISGVALSEI